MKISLKRNLQKQDNIKIMNSQEQQKYLKTQIIKQCDQDPELLKIIDTLESHTDFFTAPASTKFHLAFTGGLAIHTFGVIVNIKNNFPVWKKYNASALSLKSMIKCALLHDLCKTNYYYLQPDGTYSADFNKKGHGDRSVKMADALGIKLSEIEKNIIEFHMGAFAPAGTLHKPEEINQLSEAKEKLNTIKNYQDNFSQAVAKYPEILQLYLADHTASIRENKITKHNIKDIEQWSKPFQSHKNNCSKTI